MFISSQVYRSVINCLGISLWWVGVAWTKNKTRSKCNRTRGGARNVTWVVSLATDQQLSGWQAGRQGAGGMHGRGYLRCCMCAGRNSGRVVTLQSNIVAAAPPPPPGHCDVTSGRASAGTAAEIRTCPPAPRHDTTRRPPARPHSVSRSKQLQMLGLHKREWEENKKTNKQTKGTKCWSAQSQHLNHKGWLVHGTSCW